MVENPMNRVEWEWESIGEYEAVVRGLNATEVLNPTSPRS